MQIYRQTDTNFFEFKLKFCYNDMVIVVDTAANRLKRIKEVREQEKSISRLQVCKYRSEIISSKQNRFQRSKESKIFELEEKQQNLILQWQRALLENGNGHYLSEHSSPDDHGLKFQRFLLLTCSSYDYRS